MTGSRVAAIVLGLAAGAALVTSVPDMLRYWKMSRI